MKIRGLLIVLLLATVVVYFIYFAKTGKKGQSYIETTVDAHARMSEELTRTNLSTLEKAIDLFIGTQGRLPEDLKELARARLLTGATTDGWGRAFEYEKISDDSFRLTSAGRDGTFHTDDDIVLTR
jgi:hypothetical protein